MNAKQFVGAVYRYAGEAAAENTLASLQKPTGRRLTPASMLRSEWFANLSPGDKELVAEIAYDAARRAVFGVLCILDGVRAIEDGENRGELELYYVKSPNKTLLNDIHNELLHEISVSDP